MKLKNRRKIEYDKHKKILRFIFVFWLIFLFVNSPNWAQKTPTILQTIASSTNFTEDLTFDGEYLWTSSPGKMLAYSIQNGNLIKEVDLINWNIPSTGLAYDGENFLFNIGEGLSPIFRVNIEAAEMQGSFDFERGNFKRGMHWEDLSLLINVFYTNEQDSLFRIDTLGNVIDIYPLPTKNSLAIVYDGDNYWITENSDLESPFLYKLDDETLEPIDTFLAPGGSYPHGLAWDGEYLWLSNKDSDEIYQLDVENIQKDIKVNVYPNPFVQEINFQLSGGSSGCLVEIIDIRGAVIQTMKTTSSAFNMTFDKNRLPSGLYFYLIYNLSQEKLLAKGKIIAQ
jgi:hypothetical protein